MLNHELGLMQLADYDKITRPLGDIQIANEVIKFTCPRSAKNKGCGAICQILALISI